jgi:hypothetical protein
MFPEHVPVPDSLSCGRAAWVVFIVSGTQMIGVVSKVTGITGL